MKTPQKIIVYSAESYTPCLGSTWSSGLSRSSQVIGTQSNMNFAHYLFRLVKKNLSRFGYCLLNMDGVLVLVFTILMIAANGSCITYSGFVIADVLLGPKKLARPLLANTNVTCTPKSLSGSKGIYF